MDLEEIRKQLKSFDESLFNIPKELESAAKIFLTSETYRIYEIAARLIAGDVENIEGNVESAVKETPESIHAWCNKGMYHVLKGEAGPAREAVSQVQILTKQPQTVQKAKIDYASWLTKIGKNDSSAMLKAIEIIESVIFDEKSREKNVPESLSELSDQYLPAIIKYSYCRGVYDKVPSRWYEEKVVKVIGLVVEIQRSGNQKEYFQVYMLLVQLESTLRNLCKIHKNKFRRMDVFKEFSRQSGLEELNLQICIDELYKSSLTSTDSNFCAKTAKQILHFSFDEQLSKDEKVEYLRKVLQLCEAPFAKGESDDKFIESACQAEFSLWAFDHFEAHGESVNAEYKELYNNKCIKVLRFICQDAYFIKDKENADRRNRLEKVHDYMQQLEGLGRKSTNTAHLARVKYILGKSEAEVKKTFERALAIPNVLAKYQVQALTFYGRFLEKIGSFDEALLMYEKAISLAPGDEDEFWTQIARNRVRAINERRNQN